MHFKSMASCGTQAVTPQKRHLEGSVGRAQTVISSGGITKTSFYGSHKKPKCVLRINRDPSEIPDSTTKDVFEFDENGETPSESPFIRPVKPHEIGFPNPPGTNSCWMNASLQIVLGMKSLMDELESPYGVSVSRNCFSPILQTFLDLVRQYKRGRLLPVHKNLGNLKNALAVLDAGYAGEQQQDAPEVLIRLLDTFRDNFYEMSQAAKNPLREIKLVNNNQNPIPLPVDSVYGGNPVCNNLQFSLREYYCCPNCGRRWERDQEHLTLMVGIPMGNSMVSMDYALEQYMKTETRDNKCENCEGGLCRVDTVFSQLPRILLIELLRYSCQDNQMQKITSSVMIPSELNLRSVVDTNVVMPKPWNSEKGEKENSYEAPKPSGAKTGVDSYDDETEDDEENNKFFYKLTGILSHHGDNPNSGHYVADVYKFGASSWYHYDDEFVERVREDDVLGSSREQSGYMFVYTYRPLYDELRSKYRIVRNPNSVRLLFMQD